MRNLAGAVLAGVIAATAAGCGAGGKAALPAGVPDDLPRPADGRLRAAQDLGPRGLNLVYEVAGDAVALAAEQGARMEAAGWRLVTEVALERGVVRSWRKGDRAASVAVAREREGALVSIGYTAPRSGGAEGVAE